MCRPLLVLLLILAFDTNDGLPALEHTNDICLFENLSAVWDLGGQSMYLLELGIRADYAKESDTTASSEQR